MIHVEKTEDFEATGEWIVTTKNLVSSKINKTKYSCVMVCNGHLTEPNRPHVPGLETFKGKTLHTHEYKVDWI